MTNSLFSEILDLMTNRTTKFQIVNATFSSTNFQENEEMTDETTNVMSKIISIFTISRSSNIQITVDLINAKFKNILFFAKIDLNDETKY